MPSRSLLRPAVHVVRHHLAKRLHLIKPRTTADFSIYAPKTATQASIAEAASLYLHQLKDRNSQALTVLASREFAPWLQDSGFFHALFEAAGLGSVQDNGSSIKVVGGAVDAIPDLADFGEPRSGFSLLIGAAHGVTWEGAPSHGIEQADLAAYEDVRASLDLSVGPLAPDRPAVHVTLPLANTIFSTGKVSTTLAGTWTPGASAQPWAWAQRPQDSGHGSELIVPIPRGRDALSKLAVPLKAITPPRKVVSGLGNIVREVEVDGKACSASAELEAVIPRLLVETHIQGPMPVWALVMSEASVQRSGALKIAQSLASKTKRSEAFTALVAAGCRLHKILSGGGGWGLKKGLLSLDPQISYRSDGDEDEQAFISAFKGETSETSGVSPGAYVQFFVEERSGAELAEPEKAADSLLFGTAPAGFEETDSRESEKVEVKPDIFGAVTTGGLFFQSEMGTGVATIQTKLDVPNSYIYSR